MKSKRGLTKKDIIILLIFGALLIINIICYFGRNPNGTVGGIIEQTILLVLSFVTLVDIASYANWNILVPDFFEFTKEIKHKKEVQNYIGMYINEDINFFHDYSQERIGYILSQLGININQLDKIREELVRMRCIPLGSLDDASEKLRSLVKCDYPILIDQNKMDSAKLCYNKVRYYINTMDIMFIPDYASELSAILSFLISEKADLSKVDKLIIPSDSNFLLGVEVGKKLGKSVVKMRYSHGKIETEKCWDGNLDLHDKVIIVHDVLVSGDQIIDVYNKLPQTCYIMGCYCLISRKEWNGKERLKDKDIPCYEVLEIDDDDIDEIRKQMK